MKLNTNSKKAKDLILDEIKGYFHPSEYRPDYHPRSSIDAMKIDADAYNANTNPKARYQPTDYQKGAALVDAGSLAVYYHDQAKLLSKIYGKEVVKQWDGNKIHETYKHLIAREYVRNLRESQKKHARRKTSSKRK